MAQSLWQSVDEAKVTSIGAAPNPGWLECDTEGRVFGALDVVVDELAVRQLGPDDEVILRRQKFPIEKVVDGSPIDGMQFRSRLDAEF